MCCAQGLGPAGDAKDVYVLCPRQSSLGNREGLVNYVFCLVALIPQVIQQMTTYRCRTITILGFGESVHKTPSKTSIVGESVVSTIQQQTSQQSNLLESSCLASGVRHEY